MEESTMEWMDELERRRFLKTLRDDREFRDEVRRELLTEELLELPQTFAVLMDVVAQQRQDFTALAFDVRNYMERTIAMVGEGFEAVRSELAELRSDVTQLQSDVTELRSDVTQLQSDVTELRSDVTQLQSDVTQLRSDVTQLQSDVTQLRSDVTQLQSDVVIMKGDIAALQLDVREIRDQLAS